jgi:anti-sigma regulatory factor (Ser/Thr protein kinase)
MNVEERVREILRIKARGLDAIPAAGLAIERLAGSVGLSSLEASRFRFVIEELCADRIANGFAASQAAEVDIRLEHRPGEIVALVDDTGMPLDPAFTGAGARGMMAQFLERGFVDELHASFRGREGNRGTAIKFTGNALAELHGGTAAAPREVAESEASGANAAGEAASAEIEYQAICGVSEKGQVWLFRLKLTEISGSDKTMFWLNLYDHRIARRAAFAAFRIELPGASRGSSWSSKRFRNPAGWCWRPFRSRTARLRHSCR